jgi:hypothetical protein
MPKKGQTLSPEMKAKMSEGRKKASALRKAAPKTQMIANQIPNAPVNPATVEKKVLENPEDKPEAVKKGVQSSGETKKMEAQDFLATENTGNIAISNQLPGQKDEIKKQLKKKLPKLAPVDAKPPEKTVEGLKSNDPAAITARAPFSFNALRRKLAVG